MRLVLSPSAALPSIGRPVYHLNIVYHRNIAGSSIVSLISSMTKEAETSERGTFAINR
jgi:hypothetical protein